MPRGSKAKAIFDENKTDINIWCGKVFKGTKKSVLLGQRLHLKTCNFCKQAVEQGYKGTTKEEIDCLPKGGKTAYKINPFTDTTKLTKEAMERTQKTTPICVLINPARLKPE